MAENTALKHDFTVGTVSCSIVRLSLPMILAQPVLGYNYGAGENGRGKTAPCPSINFQDVSYAA